MDSSKNQIDMLNAYNVVRDSGEFNMHDKRAVVETGLSDEEYTFVQKNYTRLTNYARQIAARCKTV